MNSLIKKVAAALTGAAMLVGVVALAAPGEEPMMLEISNSGPGNVEDALEVEMEELDDVDNSGPGNAEDLFEVEDLDDLDDLDDDDLELRLEIERD